MLRNKNFHYCIHNSSSPIHILSQINPVHSPHCNSLDLFQYYLPICARVFKVASFPQVSPPKTCMPLSSPPYVLHVPPFSFSLFDHPNNNQWWTHKTQLLIIRFSPLSWYLVPRRPKYSPQHPILKHPQSVLPSDMTATPHDLRIILKFEFN